MSLSFILTQKKSVNNCAKAWEGVNIVVRGFEKFKDRRMVEIDATPSFEGSTVLRNAIRIMYIFVGGKGGIDMGSGKFKITYYTNKKE